MLVVNEMGLPWLLVTENGKVRDANATFVIAELSDLRRLFNFQCVPYYFQELLIRVSRFLRCETFTNGRKLGVLLSNASEVTT